MLGEIIPLAKIVTYFGIAKYLGWKMERNKTQRRWDIYLLWTRKARIKRKFPFVSWGSCSYKTTDVRDFRDFNHERKRENPFNLCQSVFVKKLCGSASLRSKNKRNGCVWCIWLAGAVMAWANGFQIHRINPFRYYRAKEFTILSSCIW